MGMIRPFNCCPLAFCIEQLLTPDKDSPNYCLPIYVSTGTQRQAPLHVFAACKDLTKIVSRELSGGENLDPTTSFQDWEIFYKYVHVQWAFWAPRCWKDLKTQVTHCLLLAWEAEQPTICQPIPTRVDIGLDSRRYRSIRISAKVHNASDDDNGHDDNGHDDNGYDDGSDKESDSDYDDDDSPPSDVNPVNGRREVATRENGSAHDEPYSLPPEATDRLATGPSTRILGAVKRNQSDSLSHPARKRQAMQRDIEEPAEEMIEEAR